MKRALLLIVVALLAIAVLLFIFNPQVLEDIWLWIVGLVGYIIGFIKQGGEWIGKQFSGKPEKAPARDSSPPAPQAVAANSAEISSLQQKISDLERQLDQEKNSSPLNDATITVLRYIDDGQTTLGLIFVKNRFFAYTLEDTKREVKVAGETRIPAGKYNLAFMPHVTKLTQRYRDRFDWFDKHLHIQDVPNFTGVYIHLGNSKKDTEGCLLVADGVNAANAEKVITHSTVAFKRFYQTVSALINTGDAVTIRIWDEEWFMRSKIKLS